MTANMILPDTGRWQPAGLTEGANRLAPRQSGLLALVQFLARQRHDMQQIG